MQKKKKKRRKIEYCQLKLPFSLFLGVFSDGEVVNWISALPIVLEYSNETQHKSNKMYKKTHKRKKLYSSTLTQDPPELFFFLFIISQLWWH